MPDRLDREIAQLLYDSEEGTVVQLRDGPRGIGMVRFFMVWSCPACSWQLDVSAFVAAAFYDNNLDKLYADVEEVLREHAAFECPHPRLIQTLWENRGRPT